MRDVVTLRGMKAAVNTRYGPPEVVHVVDVDKPLPADDELLVKVHATTVNRTDCGYRAATPPILRPVSGLTRPKRTILGNEFAGVVEAAGGSVTAFAVGDRVFGYCEGRFGAHAEYLTVPAHSSVAAMAANASFVDAAAGTEGSHYALACIRKAKVGAGDDVLVYGATGAIGSAAVQLLKHHGAHVTAVCATDHLGLVEALGADRVIDYTRQDFTADEQRYDLVIDAVGKRSFRECKRLLKPRGIYCSSDLGPLSQNPVLALITPLQRGKRVLFAIPTHDQEMIRYLGGLIESGAFKPLIDRHYPLDDIVEAYRYVETGQKVGNVVITPG